MQSGLLAELADSIANGSIRVADLTQALRPSAPIVQLPSSFAPSNPFRIHEFSRNNERGAAWYWNNFSCGEHTDTIPVQRLIAPAVVIDCSRAIAENESFILEREHIEEWEKVYGRTRKGHGC